jgi:hypothetical protein
VLAAHAGPIGERRAGDDNGAEQLWPHEQHDRPARLAIADHGGLADGFGMKRNDTLEERCFRVDRVLYGLSGDRLGEKADEIARMAGLERDANFALRLEAAYARSVPRSRIHDNEWPLILVDLRVLRRGDPHQHVVDRSGQLAPVQDDFAAELQDVRRNLGSMLFVTLATLLKDIQKENRALPRIEPIRPGFVKRARIWNRRDRRGGHGRTPPKPSVA